MEEGNDNIINPGGNPRGNPPVVKVDEPQLVSGRGSPLQIFTATGVDHLAVGTSLEASSELIKSKELLAELPVGKISPRSISEWMADMQIDTVTKDHNMSIGSI